MAKGYILLHRQIWENREIWKTSEPFDKRSAWIDLLLMANHADNDMKIGDKTVTIHRGQLHTSYRHLAERWGWSMSKVVRFIGTLIETQSVTLNGTPNGTTLTIVKYDDYQDSRNTNRNTNRNTERNTNRKQTKNDITKNDIATKNDINKKIVSDGKKTDRSKEWADFIEKMRKNEDE